MAIRPGQRRRTGPVAACPGPGRTNLLHDKLAAAGSSLVVNTSSIGNLMGRIVLDDLDCEHRRAIEFPAYGTGKLMNIVFTRGIAQRWSGDGVVSVAVHPGPVGSSFGRDSWFVGHRRPVGAVGGAGRARLSWALGEG